MPKQAVPVTANRGMAAPVVNKKYGEEDHFSEGDSGKANLIPNKKIGDKTVTSDTLWQNQVQPDKFYTDGNKLPQLNPGTRGSINNPSDDVNKSLIKRGKD